MAAWPDLYAGLEKGLGTEEATRQEIQAQFPHLPDDKLEQFTQYALSAQVSGEPHEISARDGRVFQTYHEPLGDNKTVAIGIDLTEIKKQQSALKKLVDENFELANKDALTQLSNRRHFIQIIDELLDASRPTQKSFTIGLLDLDGFKLVNDVYGHPAGDELLLQAAARLRTVLGEDVNLARLGGDEFGFVCDKHVSNGDIDLLGQKICKALASPFDLSGEYANISTSIGFARYPEAGTQRSVLFKRADFALYHAKQAGKGQSVRFSAEHELRIRRQSTLELRLGEADIDKEFDLEFQPILKPSTLEVVGFEALARWNDQVYGTISPSEFIPIAEKSGQMQRLTMALYRKALSLAAQWPGTTFLSFNLSALDVASDIFVQQLIDVTKDNNASGRPIILEITESAMIREPDSVIEVLRKLKAAGFKIALDDFGTGYSSLSHLAKMPLDYLKIDRSFLDGVHVTESSAVAVLQTICALSESLDVISVMEGVESEEQFEQVRAAKVRKVQGFLFSRPLKQQDVLTLLDTNAPGQIHAKIKPRLVASAG